MMSKHTKNFEKSSEFSLVIIDFDYFDMLLVFFFTDGYFDFGEKVWQSSGELIEHFKWFIPKESLDHRTFPTMNDRIAYIKDEFSNVEEKNYSDR